MPKPDASLARFLAAPQLARLVPHLAPETLHQLIRQGGLDACSELVAAATPAQLTSVLDLDLWRHARPEQDARFDAERFGEWIEALVDADAGVAARIVASLDEDLVVTGLSQYLRVFDPATFMPTAQSDDEPVDPAERRGCGFECELGGYLVCSIRTDAWDAMVALLGALEAGHGPRFHALMRGCRRVSNSTPEVDGLDNLLLEPEQLLHDVATDREQRRSHQGYSTAADARAFLQLARQRTAHKAPGARPTETTSNPIAAAYFRETRHDVAAAGDEGAPNLPTSAAPSGADESVVEARKAIAGLLTEAGLAPERPRALLEGAGEGASRLTRLRPLMEYVHDTDPDAYFTRTREMAFLVNTLMAGCSVQGRAFTAQEASDAVAGVCNLGLEHWPARWPGAGGVNLTPPPEDFLLDHDLVIAFEIGWATLHEQVTMFVAERLVAIATELSALDEQIAEELADLRRALLQQCEAGTPWRAREALEVVAMLDTPSFVSLQGLLDECPVIPAAMTAILEKHVRTVSATAFEFICTTTQIEAVRAFMRKLPDALRA